MIPDLQAAKLCQAIYAPSSGEFDHILEVAGVLGGIKYIGGDTVVAMRGSTTAQDWLRDLKFWPEHDAQLGFIVDGFSDGIAAFIAALKPLIKGNLVLCGHSLGAAHACIIAALIPSVQLVLFGCPRPGFRKLKNLVLAAGTHVTSYRNRNDPVCEVPWLMGLYRHIVEPEIVLSHTIPDDIFDDHQIALYVEALKIS